MNNSLTLENFDTNGVAYPFELEKKFDEKRMLQEYLNYKNYQSKHLVRCML